ALGLLLPQRALRWKPDRRRFASSRSTGSTQSLLRVSALALALLIPLAYAVRAQDPFGPGGQSLTGGARPATMVDVLIPVGPDGKPVGPKPLCYVPPELLSRLDPQSLRARIPPYLISSARCRAELVGSRQIDVSFRLAIWMLSTDENVAVELPLTN